MSYTKISTHEILVWLERNLTKKRYEHSLGTGECARDLALQFGVDPEKAYIAGLLHDCAKCFSNEKLLSIIEEKLGDTVGQDEKTNSKTLHAPVGAYMVQEEFGVTDEEIISSIRWHTVGKLNMTDFEKIIFLADKIEPRTRELWYCEPIKNCLKSEDPLNNAMLQCYRQTIKSLVDRDLIICPVTVDIYNHLQGC